jgi:hypothetical protein
VNRNFCFVEGRNIEILSTEIPEASNITLDI